MACLCLLKTENYMSYPSNIVTKVTDSWTDSWTNLAISRLALQKILFWLHVNEGPQTYVSLWAHQIIHSTLSGLSILPSKKMTGSNTTRFRAKLSKKHFFLWKAETEYSQDLEFYHKLHSYHWIMEDIICIIFHGANHFIVGFYLKHISWHSLV